ncbi:hypothetical protein [Robertkochia flava]|uniref:hypothetical protein n=1 Tax=Robertkochia flava TaxID=3447986 RepID=UPI001CC8F062|nr:hypothetical protein [Robertkochia marina]
MKIRFLPTLVLASMLSLTGCMKGDIDDLQNQIDDLTSKVDELEATQQEALLKAIAELENKLSSLNSDLVAELELIEQEIANNADAVFYGNVLTEEDYAALEAQGATIITGKVMVTQDAHVQALSNVKLIGKNLEINGGMDITFDALQSIGEHLHISGLVNGAVVNLSRLSSVGGDVEITHNGGLTSLSADELVLVGGALHTEMNPEVTSMSFMKLDQVGSLYINGYWNADPEEVGIGVMTRLELSSSDVKGNVDLSYIGAVDNISLGNIGGSFKGIYNKIAGISLESTKIPGDFILEFNPGLTTVDAGALERIEGKLSIRFNDNSIYWSATEKSGLSAMPAFPALQYIGGDVELSNNSAMKTMEAFNAVTEVAGDYITIGYNGSDMDYVNVFNALVETGASQFSNADVSIHAKTNWFKGFEALPIAKHVRLEILLPTEEGGGGIGPFAVNGIARVDGFDAMTELSTLTMLIQEVTEFNAFGALNNFQNYQTYLRVYMPNDENVGLCSMRPILEKVKNGDFDLTYNENRKAFFSHNWSEMDRDLAIDQLLAPCGI